MVRLADGYPALNEEYQSPVAYSLGDWGFYSEVDDLLNVVLFCLVRRRRLFVDQSQFGGYRWSSFFDTDLPSAAKEIHEVVPAEATMTGLQHPLFGEIQRWAARRYKHRLPIFLKELDFLGGLFGAKRYVASILVAMRNSPLRSPRRRARA